jgi:serine/threonine protein kinase
MQATVNDVCHDFRPWDPSEFEFVRTLQAAPRNDGRVDEMKFHIGTGSIRTVAVKRMKTSWVRSSHTEFQKVFPHEGEQPWVDVGIVKELNRLGFPYVCELLGLFRCEEHVYVVNSLATYGDLFCWSTNLRAVGRERELVLRPLAVQVCDAVRWLHDIGIAHRDLSLENTLLTESGEHDVPQVRIADFAMAGLKRFCSDSDCGKNAYKAPEVFSQREYDAYLADGFAVGVMIFSAVASQYPWRSTLPSGDPSFTMAKLFGLQKYFDISKYRLPDGSTVKLTEAVTPELLQLLEGLMAVNPCMRTSLGEMCFIRRPLKLLSVWSTKWFEGLQPHAHYPLQQPDLGATLT